MTGRATAVELLSWIAVLGVISQSRASWVPPTDPTEFETVEEMRNRLNIQYDYTPISLHPEVCRYQSETACQVADEEFETYSIKDKERISETSAASVLVVLVYFADHQNRTNIDPSTYSSLWMDDIQKEFKELDIFPTVVEEWFPLGNTEAFFAGGVSGLSPETQKAFWPVLNAIDEKYDGDWSPFDLDDDGILDSVFFVHSGYGAEEGFIGGSNSDPVNRIWSHSFASVPGLKWTSAINSRYSLGAYSVVPAFEQTQGTVPAVAAEASIHEFRRFLDGHLATESPAPVEQGLVETLRGIINNIILIMDGVEAALDLMESAFRFVRNRMAA